MCQDIVVKIFQYIYANTMKNHVFGATERNDRQSIY